MIGFGSLLLVLFVLYLLECASWIPPGAIAFRWPIKRRSPLRVVTKPGPRSGSSIAFSFPLLFRSAILLSSWPSISISPEGIVDDSKGVFWAFDRISRIELSDRIVLINDNPFFRAASQEQANGLARLLKRLRSQECAARSDGICEYLAACLDVGGAASTLDAFANQTFHLSLDCFLLLFIAFVASPLAVFKFGLVRVWPFILLCLLLNVAVILWDFRAAEKALFPHRVGTRWEAFLTILLSPPAALHAIKYLARDVVAAYHPLAVASARCTEADFDTLASWNLRQLMFVPAAPAASQDGQDGNDSGAECAEWFRRELLRQVSSLVRKKGRRPDLLVSPPPRQSEMVKSYCPRCWSEFVVAQGVCTDCGGVQLCSFREEQR
jgi:hypothetical protein